MRQAGLRELRNRVRRDVGEYRYAIAGLLLYYVVTRLVFRAFCPLVIVTGLPCPGCGLSRAVWFFLTGQFARSFSLHPLGAFWLALLLYAAVRRYAAGQRISKGLCAAFVILCSATLGLYGYRMAFVFPDRPPMSYTGRNIMERCIPDYRQKVLGFFRLYR